MPNVCISIDEIAAAHGLRQHLAAVMRGHLFRRQQPSVHEILRDGVIARDADQVTLPKQIRARVADVTHKPQSPTAVRTVSVVPIPDCGGLPAA